jgi:ribosome-associated translation inhibitor RaiA
MYVTPERTRVMQTPVDLHFRHELPHSPSLEQEVYDHVKKLETFFDRITSCRVVIDAPHQHQQHGRIYRVDIDLAVPGEILTVNRASDGDHAHEDLHVAVRDSFKAMRRQLQDYVGKLRKRA